jgi:hypothetical protein
MNRVRRIEQVGLSREGSPRYTRKYRLPIEVLYYAIMLTDRIGPMPPVLFEFTPDVGRGTTTKEEGITLHGAFIIRPSTRFLN